MPVRAAILLFLTGVMAGCRDEAVSTVCVADEDCESGSRCHPSARICVPDCRSTDDCPEGESCGVDGLCACDPASSGCPGVCHPDDRICVEACGHDEDCSAGRVCCQSDGVQVCMPDAGRCTPQGACASDDGCDGTDRCDMTRSPPTCVPRGACTSKEDCDLTEVCDPMLDPPACSAWLSCATNADCAPGTCDMAKHPPRCSTGG